MDDDYFISEEMKNDERRGCIPTRRVGMPDCREHSYERRLGPEDRRTTTDDKEVAIVTTHGNYNGTINLNAASERVDRVSDFFLRGDFAFLPLYNATVIGQSGKVTLLNVKNIAFVIPNDKLFPRVPELRCDVDVKIRLSSNLGQITGKVNLRSEKQEVNRVSDLLNYPGKRWLVLYDANLKGKRWGAIIINLDFISAVED